MFFVFSSLSIYLSIYAFVEAAALRSIDLRYAGVPIATPVSFFYFIFAFSEYFVPFPLSLCIESTSYVLSFRMAFFLPCDHGLDFSGLSSGVSPRFFYCGKTTTIISVQAVTVIKNNYRYCATRYREKTNLFTNTVQNATEESITSRYHKTNYRAKSGVPAISGYRGVNFRNNDKTPNTAQK